MTNVIQFAPATREAVYSRTCLYGPGGAGKTYTMLTMLFELAPTGRVAVIDTERGRARKYLGVNGWQWDTVEPHSFSPESLTAAIAAATEAGYEAIGIDSGSHYWNGADGMQEQVDRRTVASGRRDSFGSGWKEMGPIERRMWDAVMTAPMHVVMTLRVKSDYVIEEKERDGRRRAEPKKVGLKPVQRDGFDYEFDVVGALDQDGHTLTVVKSDLVVVPVGATYDKPGPEFAKLIGEFCAQGVTTDGPLAYRARALADDLTYDDALVLYAKVDQAGLGNTPVLDEHSEVITLGDLIKRRGAAVKAAAEAAKRAASTATPAAPASKGTPEERAKTAVDLLFTAVDQIKAGALESAARSEATVGGVDVSGLLDDNQRDVLGVKPSDKLTLLQLAEMVAARLAEGKPSVADAVEASLGADTEKPAKTEGKGKAA